jgi:hypothetical protein
MPLIASHVVTWEGFSEGVHKIFYLVVVGPIFVGNSPQVSLEPLSLTSFHISLPPLFHADIAFGTLVAGGLPHMLRDHLGCRENVEPSF